MSMTMVDGSSADASKSAIGVVVVDHVGFSVSSLEDAIRFWSEAMGFTLERSSEMGGDFLLQSTGVGDPHCRMALMKAPDGFHVELLEYSTGRRRGKVPDSAGAIGAVHLAVTVADIQTAVAQATRFGWHAKGMPQPIPAGPRRGTMVVYISGPDGVTIELMEPR